VVHIVDHIVPPPTPWQGHRPASDWEGARAGTPPQGQQAAGVHGRASPTAAHGPPRTPAGVGAPPLAFSTPAPAPRVAPQATAGATAVGGGGGSLPAAGMGAWSIGVLSSRGHGEPGGPAPTATPAGSRPSQGPHAHSPAVGAPHQVACFVSVALPLFPSGTSTSLVSGSLGRDHWGDSLHSDGDSGEVGGLGLGDNLSIAVAMMQPASAPWVQDLCAPIGDTTDIMCPGGPAASSVGPS
jgi:hypothetical protein